MILGKRRILSELLAAMVLLISIFIANAVTVNAESWLGRTQNINLNTWHADSITEQDIDMYEGYGIGVGGWGYRGDAYKFIVPAKGKITIKLENDDSRNYLYSAQILIYNSSNVEKSILHWYAGSDLNHSSARGVYYANKEIELNKGTYYCIVRKELSYGGLDSYNLLLNYKPTFAKTEITKIKAAKKSLKIRYRKAGGATGYQIQYSANKKFKKAKTINTNKTTRNIKKLKKNKRYYVRVRTYKKVTVNGKVKTYYSKWSKTKSVRVK